MNFNVSALSLESSIRTPVTIIQPNHEIFFTSQEQPTSTKTPEPAQVSHLTRPRSSGTTSAPQSAGAEAEIPICQ
jgi:hypothetical protein